MMMTGIFRSSGSRLSRLHTEKPFILGSSVHNKMRSGGALAACWSPTDASSTIDTSQDLRLNSACSSLAKERSLSKIRILGMIVDSVRLPEQVDACGRRDLCVRTPHTAHRRRQHSS